MKNILLAGAAVLTLGSCCFFGDYVEGNGRMVVRDFHVGSFDEIELASIGKVVISQNERNEVTVIAEENILERMEIDDRGDTLVIGQEYGVNLHPTEEPLILVKTPWLERAHITGAGEIISDGTIYSTGKIRLIIEGAGDIDMDVMADDVVCVITGAGDIRLQGSAPRVDYNINGYGDIEAFDMDSEIVDAVINGTGNIELTANEYLHAIIDGVGTIYYQGHPTKYVDIDGWGSVQQR